MGVSPAPHPNAHRVAFRTAGAADADSRQEARVQRAKAAGTKLNRMRRLFYAAADQC